MAARRKKTAGRERASRQAGGRRTEKTTTHRAASRQSGARLDVLEPPASELPPTLHGFSRRVNAALTKLESRIDRGEAGSPKRAARMLRDASYELGRLESEGEQGWKALDENARKKRWPM